MKRLFSILIAAVIFIMSSPVSAGNLEFAQGVLDLVNVERAKVGANPLQLNNELIECADIRAEEIIGTFSHTRPDGSSCFTVLKGVSYHTVGENIAAGASTPESVVDQWMHSTGHRANILNPAFKYLGVGYAYKANSDYGHYWVQLFIG